MSIVRGRVLRRPNAPLECTLYTFILVTFSDYHSANFLSRFYLTVPWHTSISVPCLLSSFTSTHVPGNPGRLFFAANKTLQAIKPVFIRDYWNCSLKRKWLEIGNFNA
jgi:hypothetical protein